jgi:hypothetical protein
MSKSRLITVVTLGLMTLQARAADKSLVLYLPFDEGAGATATDVSSYGNPGTVVGNALWVAGAKGTALEFVNGSHVTIPEIPQYDVTSEVSLMAWVKATTVPNWARVIDKSQWQTSGFDLVLTQNAGLPRLEFFVNNTTSLADGTTAVIDNEWHFIAGTFGNKTIRVYVNGKMEGQAQSVGQVDINPNNLPVMIGGESSSNGGQQYLGSIDEVAMYNRELSADEIANIFRNGMAAPEVALSPKPQNAAVDVPQDTVLGWTAGGFAASHDVYLGVSADDVENATRDNPLGVLVSQGQIDATYTPASLEFGTTYYWRIDEVNAAPDYTIFKGSVWSFTVEPYSYPVTPVAATASGSGANMGPQNTINGSGLNANDQHSVESTQMWLSNTDKPAWIQYEFDRTYKLDKMWVWNSNQAIESMLGFGAKTVAIEYSADGQTWATLENVPEFAQATGTPTYTANTIVDFGGAAAKFVKLTIESNWGGAVPRTGLSEVRFFYVPVQAFYPEPAIGATDVSVETELSWRPGREATSHTVYVGADSDAVAGGQVPGKTVAENTFAPASLNLATKYYWKVDEAGDDGPYPGDVWNFTTEDFITVDSFESYNNDAHRIYDSWIDGITDSKSGSQVGYDEAPFAETSTVHGGAQSMPLIYNNTTFGSSEATRTFESSQDWTGHGITTLALYFRGQLANSPASVYVKINDAKIPFNNGAAATTMYLWKSWLIPLASTNANLKSVKSLTIGVEGAGSGTLFVDDIRLYAAAPETTTPADPGTTGLVALYAMDGTVQDSSGKGNNGTLKGDGSYDVGYAGQALVFNGINTYVELPLGTLMTSLTNTTVATHVHFGGGSGSWQRLFDFGSGTNAYMFLCPRQGTSGNMRFAIRTAATGEQIVDSPKVMTEGWHHTAVTLDSATMRISLYLDGDLVASGPTVLLPKDIGNTTQNWLGRSQYIADAYFLGSIDDFRIYDRVLSPAELRYLAGDR